MIMKELRGKNGTMQGSQEQCNNSGCLFWFLITPSRGQQGKGKGSWVKQFLVLCANSVQSPTTTVGNSNPAFASKGLSTKRADLLLVWRIVCFTSLPCQLNTKYTVSLASWVYHTNYNFLTRDSRFFIRNSHWKLLIHKILLRDGLSVLKEVY